MWIKHLYKSTLFYRRLHSFSLPGLWSTLNHSHDRVPSILTKTPAEDDCGHRPHVMAAYDGHMEQEQRESQDEESSSGSIHVDCRVSGTCESSTSGLESRMFGLENRMSGLGDDLSYRQR
jgi:hypothetical protein